MTTPYEMKQREIEEAGGYWSYLNKKLERGSYLMQLIRTVCSTTVVVLQVVILLKLFEIIPGPKTNPEVLEFFNTYAEQFLGKTTVIAKDTPAFIGNRIGVYAMQVAMYEALEQGLPVEIADALFGRPLGIPKTGVFGLYDLIGIDLMKDVLASFKKELHENDPFMDVVAPHP